jgi:hypothetical protein
VIALLFVLGCHRDTGPAVATKASLVYTGNVDGEIEPCG